MNGGHRHGTNRDGATEVVYAKMYGLAMIIERSRVTWVAVGGNEIALAVVGGCRVVTPVGLGLGLDGAEGDPSEETQKTPENGQKTKHSNLKDRLTFQKSSRNES